MKKQELDILFFTISALMGGTVVSSICGYSGPPIMAFLYGGGVGYSLAPPAYFMAITIIKCAGVPPRLGFYWLFAACIIAGWTATEKTGSGWALAGLVPAYYLAIISINALVDRIPSRQG